MFNTIFLSKIKHIFFILAICMAPTTLKPMRTVLACGALCAGTVVTVVFMQRRQGQKIIDLGEGLSAEKMARSQEISRAVKASTSLFVTQEQLEGQLRPVIGMGKVWQLIKQLEQRKDHLLSQLSTLADGFDRAEGLDRVSREDLRILEEGLTSSIGLYSMQIESLGAHVAVIEKQLGILSDC